MNVFRYRRQAGFTLIELLVAMAVSLVVLFGVLNLFDNSQRSYVVQEDVAEMQQNVRIGKMFLERDIRMAGAGIPNFSYGGIAVYPFEFENNIDGTIGRAKEIVDAGNIIVSGSDLLVVRYYNFGAEKCGADPSGINDACDELPQLTLTSDMPDTATVAIVVEDLTSGVGWDDDCYCQGSTFTQPTPGMPLIITTPDGSQSSVLFLTSTLPESDKLGNAPNFTYEGVTYPNKVLNTYPAGSTINFFPLGGIYEAIYSIQNRDGIPCLVRDTGDGGQVIAEYIEDLQLSFGLDTNDDGSIDATVSSADLTNLQKNQVRMVTMNLLGRSAHEQRNFDGQRPAMEDHGAGAADSFRRRQVTVTVKVRNLGL